MKYLFIISLVLFPALANAQSLVNPVIVRPQINNGLVNGTGMQTAGVSGCSTTAVVGNCCNVTVSYPNAFPDTSYNNFCMCGVATSGIPVVIAQSTINTTQVTVATCTPEAAVSGCSVIVCLGIHP